MILSDKKLASITNASSYQEYWYITKQILAFDELCYIASILEAWNDDQNVSYQTFFDEHKTESKYGGFSQSVAHRATRNCEPIGLIYNSSNYSSKELTPVYFAIKALCNSNFKDTSKYQDIIDSQLEKILYNNDKGFLIHPIMFILKVLLIIGDVTGKYGVSIPEFKIFIATAKKWNEYFEVVESILRYRSDSDYKNHCDANAGKFSDCRYNILASNHSLLNNDNNGVYIIDGCIQEARKKVAQYELRMLDIDNLESYKKSLYSIDKPSDTAQTIYYGCPGTGKSFEVKRLSEGEHGEKTVWYSKEKDAEGKYPRVYNPTKEEQKELTNNIFRTTFHPDYDYATFVGCYKPVKNGNSIDYLFVPQVFTNAYVAAYRHKDDPVYLIIEEINRGNCAQIFGDLFQLLDRNDQGESDYPIKPDTELAKYLESLNENLPTEELKLPHNLHIYATMNTSDQSLFPMDSAFKRRWAMEYKPIEYDNEKAVGFTFKVNGKEHSWVEFLQKVNYMILNATDSEDKQMGEFFIKSSVSEKEFINKVMFYIWNDVCKDLYSSRRISPLYFMKITEPKDGEREYFTFADLYSPRNENSRLLEGFLTYLDKKYEERGGMSSSAEKQEDSATPESN